MSEDPQEQGAAHCSPGQGQPAACLSIQFCWNAALLSPSYTWVLSCCNGGAEYLQTQARWPAEPGRTTLRALGPGKVGGWCSNCLPLSWGPRLPSARPMLPREWVWDKPFRAGRYLLKTLQRLRAGPRSQTLDCLGPFFNNSGTSLGVAALFILQPHWSPFCSALPSTSESAVPLL